MIREPVNCLCHLIPITNCVNTPILVLLFYILAKQPRFTDPSLISAVEIQDVTNSQHVWVRWSRSYGKCNVVSLFQFSFYDLELLRMNTTHSFKSPGPTYPASDRHVREHWNTLLHSRINLKTLNYKFPLISVHLLNNSSIFCFFSSRYLACCYAFPKSKPPNNSEQMHSALMFFALQCSGSFSTGSHCLCY